MKLLVLFCLFVGSFGEAPRVRAPGQLQPPRFRAARFRSQRFEIVPTTESSAEPTTDSIGGPYPASGWKPAGAPFTLPSEMIPADAHDAPQESAPYPPSWWKPTGKPFQLPQEQSPPSTSYGTPDKVYGVPDDTYGVPTTDVPSTESPENLQVEKIEGPVEVLKSVGTYFVLLPSGQLQKLKVTTENDAQNMRYTARLQLRNPAPLFAYGR